MNEWLQFSLYKRVKVLWKRKYDDKRKYSQYSISWSIVKNDYLSENLCSNIYDSASYIDENEEYTDRIQHWSQTINPEI